MKYLTNSGLSYFFNKMKTYISSAIPTKTSDLTNDSDFIDSNNLKTINNNSLVGTGNITITANTDWNNVNNKPSTFTPSSHTHSASDITSGLATVATSGSYNDLSNKPTIPTVNNATLTIQKNGTNVATFTSNSNTDVTANISVPTKTSDLTNDSGFLTLHQDLSGYVPRSGGTVMTGDVLGRNVDDDNLRILGGSAYNTGAQLQLCGKDLSGGLGGTFTLYANSGSNICALQGTPSGALTWGKKNVATQEYVVPRSGGSVMSGDYLARTVDNSLFTICGGTGTGHGGIISLYGKDASIYAGTIVLQPSLSSSSYYNLILHHDGTATWGSKNLAMQEDVIPRSGGAVMTGNEIAYYNDFGGFALCGGSSWSSGGVVQVLGASNDNVSAQGIVRFLPTKNGTYKDMVLYPDGTWTWNGAACQITSDQRLKQQIAQIDDKLLDAWEDVNLVQFKYNDAVDQKGKDKARLHTGYVVQQINSACKEHGVDVSQYGLYCHEEYPEETEEVEVENEDGTKTKERKVIREASEHYSLRYTEVYAIECAYLRKQIKELIERLEKLEGNSK